MSLPDHSVPVTVLIAARNEEANLPKCLAALKPAQRVVLLDSQSKDRSASIAEATGAEVVQFHYAGGHPKKRQWALDTLPMQTEWVLLIDADEVVPEKLWHEISTAIADPKSPNGFLITKGFHFLGKAFRRGGFSFAAMLLIRHGKAKFERTLAGAGDGLDMEVHERVIIEGPAGKLKTPLIHEDFKGLQAYLDRHNKYSTWEAALRHAFLKSGSYGEQTIKPRLFGNTQERRRFLKALAVKVPGEAWLWFVYHYFLKLGFLEGRAGLIACQIRSAYIRDVRAKMYELSLAESQPKKQ